MASPNSLKRTYAETGLENLTDAQDHPSTFQAIPTSFSMAGTLENASTRAPAEALQITKSPGSPPMPGSSAPNTESTYVAAPLTASQPLTEKPKFTFSEKEARRVEKEMKERQKAEEKARKEEEKAEEKARKEEEKAEEKAKKEAKREEEKRVKEAEKEQKLRIKEEEKRLKLEELQLKEEERHRKEEERIKKARVSSLPHMHRGDLEANPPQSQLRINSFFTQPSLANRTATRSPTRDGPSPLSSRRSSISDHNAVEEKRRSRSVSATPQKSILPDYERCFPPFFVKAHTTLAPSNRFTRDEEGLSFAQKKIDEGLQSLEDDGVRDGESGGFDPYELLHLATQDHYRCFPRLYSVKDIIAEIEGAVHNPIDLTESQFTKATKKPLDFLKKIPVKYLKFAEDVRPPYTGTYTRLRDTQAIEKLARNPFCRGLPETNYEYDSEAEWEEPGEGEDLDSEGEEEVDDEDEAEMKDFLDDEDAVDARAVKRRPILGDLEPTCSGLCWEGPQSNGSRLDTIHLLTFKLDILMGKPCRQCFLIHADRTDNPQLPIDPYTTAYWQPTNSNNSVQASSRPQGSLMEPPRIPLNLTNRQNAKLSSPDKDFKSDPPVKMKPSKGPKRFLPSELMNEFKNAVQGNDLTKVGILEILKKQYVSSYLPP